MRLIQFNLLGGIMFLPGILIAADDVVRMFFGAAYFAGLIILAHKWRPLRAFFRAWLGEIEKLEKELFN